MQYRNIDKQALKENGYTVLSKITIVGTQTVFTEDDYIVDWDYEDYRFVPNTGFIGQFVERILDGNLQNISDGVILEDTEINLKLGIKNALDNNTVTWYDYGNFLVTKVEKTDTTGNYKFESADYTKKFNKVFDGDYTDTTYTKSFNDKIEDGETVTALWLAQYACKQAGVVLYTTNFTNYNFVISSNQYDSEDTLRKVMQDIGKLAYSWVRVGEDNKVHIDFTPKATSSVDQYDQLTTDEYYVSKKSDLAFGPVNKVLIGMSDVEGENLYVTSQDYTPETECAIKIYDNNLTNTEELRQTALNGASRLFGLTYTPMEINSVGHPWLDGDELIKLTNVDEEVIYTYPFNRKIHYAGYIEGVIGAEASTSQNSEYEYKSDIISNVKRTTIIVDKQEQTITALAEDVSDNSSDISQLQIDLNGIDLRVQSVETTEVTAVTNEYAVNDSATTPPAESSSSWSTTKPTRGEGQYIWARIKTTYKSGNIAYSDPVNTTGDKGDDGGDGKGITSINVYYKTTPTQDEPSAASITSTTIPEMDATTNKYLWQKQVTNYNDDTSTTTVTLIGVYGDKGEDADPAVMYHNAVGTNITTEDAGELELKSINKLEGETTQETTTGKNILEPYPISSTNHGITASYDSSTQTYTFNGTCDTDNTTFRIGNSEMEVISGITRSSVHLVSGNVTNYCTIRHYNSNYSRAISYSIINLSNTSPIAYGTASNDFTSPYNMSSIRFDNGSVANNLKIKIMVAQSLDTTYEPYTNGASPNPDYPQEIKNVTGRQEVEICGKNLAQHLGGYVNNTGTFKTSNDDSFYFYVIQGETYIYNTSGNRTVGAIFEKIPLNNDTCISGTYINGIAKNTPFVASATGYMVIYANTPSSQTVINDFIAIKGNTIGTYEPYTGNSYEVNLGKNLVGTTNVSSTTTNGITYSVVGDTITINGTATANTTIMTTTNFALNKNTTYTLSFTTISGTKDSTYMGLRFRRNGSQVAFIQTNTPGSKSMDLTNINDVQFYIISGTVFNNYSFKFQLETGSVATDFSPYFEPIELCKINTYKDYIRKSTGINLFDNVLDNSIALARATITYDNGQIVMNTTGADAYFGSITNTIGESWNETRGQLIKVEPNTSYTFSITSNAIDKNFITYYNEDKKSVKVDFNVPYQRTFTTPANAKYMSFRIGIANSTSGGVYKFNVQVEKGSATPYEPYGKVWYLHKEVGKVVLDGTDDIISSISTGLTNTTRIVLLIDEDIKVKDSYCNRLKYNGIWNKDEEGYYYDAITGNTPNSIVFRINKSTVGTTLQQAETYFTSNNLIFYYVKNIPTTTEITNQELIDQLNAFEQAKLNEGINNIDVIGNLPMILDLDYWTYYKGETGRSIESITEEYALSTSSSSVTGTWSTDVPTMTNTNKYLWNRETITYANPTSSETGEPKIIGVYGLQGDTGKGIKSVTELYYVSNSSTAPAKPSSHVTRSDLITYNQWNLQCPPYTTTYKYFYTCSEIEYDTNPVTYGWTNVTQNQALAIANQNAYNATTTANTAVNTVNNLKIGGRNLVLLTSIASVATGTGGTNQITGSYYFSDFYMDNYYSKTATAGESITVTCSCDWEASTDSGKFQVQLGGWPYSQVVSQQTLSASNQSGHLEKTLIIEKLSSQTTNYTRLSIRLDNLVGSVTLTNFKIEIGNKATDWTPAPEDTENTISNLNTYVDNNIQNLQNQIDGAIQFWNGANIPTLNNYPANQWTTEADRTNHQADIYTVIQDVSGELKQGKSYRFDKVSGTWQWIELTDNELSAVQALASSKAKVYVTTPTVPYNIGDLWLNNNKLYRCKTAKDNSGSYAAADWELATDYTNDDTANTAIGLVNNLSIGGRNLITESTYTAAPSSNANWAAGAGNTISVSYANGGRTGKVPNGNFGEIQLFTTLEQINCKATDNITFSCDVKLLPLDNETEPDVSDYVYLGYSLYYDGTSHSPNWYTGAQLKWDSTTKGAKYGEWTRLHIVFPGYTGTYNYQKLMFGVIAKANQANSDIKFVIRNCKIERGNKPTDWTAAPEDISNEINDVNSNFSNYVTTEAYDSDWQTRKDEILGTVEGTYTTQSAFGTYQEQMSTALSMKADSATITATASAVVKNAISGIEDTVNDINETFTFDTNGLTIARGSNTMYLRLQNNRLSFKTDESETGERAYMTSNEFVLKELQSFQIGAFKFEVRTNGSLDFKKV